MPVTITASELGAAIGAGAPDAERLLEVTTELVNRYTTAPPTPSPTRPWSAPPGGC